ncbi:MAG UNVERIFIED_CONTAM: hypothetical protein LVR29_04265 [Microcystis novacekii LVE1205-3]
MLKRMLATAAVIVFIVTTWPNLSSVISYQLSVISFNKFRGRLGFDQLAERLKNEPKPACFATANPSYK